MRAELAQSALLARVIAHRLRDLPREASALCSVAAALACVVVLLEAVK